MTLLDNDTGYQYCACRDCFEITIGHPGVFCFECRVAGCEHDQECAAPGSYGGFGEASEENFGEETGA